jgi:hypothetical protein
MRKTALISAVMIWAVLVGIGFVWLTDYSTRPGKPANVSAKLPPEIYETLNKTLPKVILFVHPQCACSRATLSELERILAENENRAEVKIFFYKPEQESDDWVKTNLWRQANEMPSVKVGIMNESEMEKFGVITSGQTIVYDLDGNVVFSGGITYGRGHEGMSRGRKAIEEYLQSGRLSVSETSVFGCALTSQEL